MEKRGNHQGNINCKPIHNSVFRREESFCRRHLLNQHKIDVATQITHNYIHHHYQNNPQYHSRSGLFRPGKFLVQLLICKPVAKANEKRIHQTNQKSIEKILHRFLVRVYYKEKKIDAKGDPKQRYDTFSIH